MSSDGSGAEIMQRDQNRRWFFKMILPPVMPIVPWWEFRGEYGGFYVAHDKKKKEKT